MSASRQAITAVVNRMIAKGHETIVEVRACECCGRHFSPIRHEHICPVCKFHLGDNGEALNDWAVYVGLGSDTPDEVARLGDKVYSDDALAIVGATEEAKARYRR